MQSAEGKPLPFYEAVVGGRSVGAPGTVVMLEAAHKQYGKLAWAALFQPAIRLAEDGFKVSARLNTLLASEAHLKKDPVAAAYFYDVDGKAWPVGHVLKNPALALVLKRIARDGANAMRQGEIAQAIVDKVQKHPTNPGKLSLQDIASYQHKQRTPICTDYSAQNKNYQICGMPPPSSGAIAVAQILGILGNTNAGNIAPEGDAPAAGWLHLYLEASRLAFADRAQYLGDPDFVTAPAGDWNSLVAPDYLAERAKLIGPASMKTGKPGQPGAIKVAYGLGADQPEYGTSHISIIDGFGNAISMTTTIEDAFGSRQMVNFGGGQGGFLLNNELTDFNFAPNDADGKPTANRVQPGKRPRSSMAPTLVLDKATGQVVMSGGSPGGALIIHYTAKTLYGVLNWGLNTQQAINLPNFAATGAPTLLEEKRFSPATVDYLKGKGHEVREQNMTSGLQAIERTSSPAGSGLFGGADPRREGVVMGD